jgi:3-oxoacyl-[acyl-carrier-protein] synthase-1
MAAVRAGLSGLSEHPFLVNRKSEPVRATRDSMLDAAMPVRERMLRLVASALHQTRVQLGTLDRHTSTLPFFLALPERRVSLADGRRAAVQALQEGLARLESLSDLECANVFEDGHAAGVSALEAASQWIRSGRAELCIVAGVDSFLDRDTIAWLDRNRQLATSYHRGAFFPGEGAGAFAIASRDAIERYGLEPLARVRGLGIAMEAHPIKSEAVCVGDGLTACVRQAIADLRQPDERIDGIICDINGERYRSEEWGFALLRLPDAFVAPTAYDMPAASWGDVGAASGPLFVVMAALAGKRGWAKGARYLIWTSSESGRRGAVLLELGMHSRGGLQ